MSEKDKQIRERRKIILNINSLGDTALEKNLKSMYDRKEFDPEMYAYGQTYFEDGLPLEDAPDEYKNNRSFKAGYDRGKRLAYAAELQKNSHKR